jgi:pimeloyl-ACP methyl ester carboxylesterase
MIDDECRRALDNIDARASERLLALIPRHGSFAITVDELAAAIDTSTEMADQMLRVLESSFVLEREQRHSCPNCGTVVSAADSLCERCGRDIIGEHNVVAVYQRQRPPSRDVPWMLLLHGMNTTGAWQEQFSWRAALTYGHSVPVFSYKYGRLRPGVLIPWRRAQLIHRTAAIIRELGGDAQDRHLGTRPDVIAHSFGTWLITETLLRQPAVAIGRLVLLGSIVPIDFDWTRLASQIDGVLNHYGTRDHIVALSHFFIPRSGPSGRRGFSSDTPRQVAASGWRHSDFFKPVEHLHAAWRDVWTPFLTDPSQ